jgi:farnesyl diphosphate synthase
MMELFHEVSYKTEVGQSCDMITATADANIGSYTMQQYLFIVTHETAYYSFYLPVALVLMYTQQSTARNQRITKDITVKMGDYFQVQDDYLDAFAEPTVLGKIGTDIVLHKYSWLALQGTARCNGDQMAILKSNYGRRDPDCEARVQDLYRELKLDAVYDEHAEKTAAEAEEMIMGILTNQKVCERKCSELF